MEYAIALFNGVGVEKDEAAAAAAHAQGGATRQRDRAERLARILAAGRGANADAVEAAKWHTIAKARGLSDSWLDEFMIKLTPAERAAGEKAARPWIEPAAATRPRS